MNYIIFSIVPTGFLATEPMYYYSILTLSKLFQPTAAQLSMKAALPLAKMLVMTSCRNSNRGPTPICSHTNGLRIANSILFVCFFLLLIFTFLSDFIEQATSLKLAARIWLDSTRIWGIANNWRQNKITDILQTTISRTFSLIAVFWFQIYWSLFLWFYLTRSQV